MFTFAKLDKTINTASVPISLNGLRNCILSQSLTNMYFCSVFDDNRFIIFDINWVFIRFVVLDAPWFLISVENDLYFTSNTAPNLFKSDFNGIKISQALNGDIYRRGLFYCKENNTIFVASVSPLIEIFDRNLNKIKSIAVSYQPHNVAIYNGNIYAHTLDGKLLVINDLQTTVISVCVYIPNIFIDKYGYIAIPCINDNNIFLFHVNGSFMGKKIYTNQPIDVIIDRNGRLVVVHDSSIDILDFL